MREVLKVRSYDHICASLNCRGEHVPVVWVGQAQSFYQGLEARYQRVALMGIH
jgi:hypothetical protein